MKLLVATDVTAPGGVDVYVRELVAALVEAGHGVEVAVERQSRSALVRAPDQVGAPVHPIRLHHRSHPAEAVIAEVGALLDRSQPDGVHVVCGAPWSCLALRQQLVERGVPLVLTEQYVPEAAELTAAQHAVVESSYRHARSVLFVSEGNRRTMDALVGLDGVSWEVVPNGVRAGAIARRSPPLEDRVERLRASQQGGARVLSALRLSPEKGVHDLLEAIADLQPGAVGRLDVFGEGAERAALEARRRALGLGDVVRLRPWARDPVSEMASRDLFVLPSLEEGLSIVLLEAMAAGIPIVATDTAGSVDALADGAAGRVVPRGNPPALADGIAAALADPAESAGRAAIARARAARHYELDKLMRHVIRLWGDGPSRPTRGPAGDPRPRGLRPDSGGAHP